MTQKIDNPISYSPTLSVETPCTTVMPGRSSMGDKLATCTNTRDSLEASSLDNGKQSASISVHLFKGSTDKQITRETTAIAKNDLSVVDVEQSPYHSNGVDARFSQAEATREILMGCAAPKTLNVEVDGKFFEIYSDIDYFHDRRDYCWCWKPQGEAQDRYVLEYRLKYKSTGQRLNEEGKLPAFIDAQKIESMQSMEQSLLQDLCKQHSFETASALAKEQYGWAKVETDQGPGLQLLPRHPEKVFLFATNQTSGLLPSFLNLEVLKRMLLLEHLQDPAQCSEAAVYGACAGFSAKWLSLVVRGEAGLIEDERHMAEWYVREQKTPEVDSMVGADGQNLTLAERRMVCLSFRGGSESAQLQNIYSDEHRQFYTAKIKREAQIRLQADEMEGAVGDLQRKIFHLEADWEAAVYSDPKAIDRQMEEAQKARVELQKTIELAADYKALAALLPAKPIIADKEGYGAIHLHFKTLGLSIKDVIYKEDADPSAFLNSLHHGLEAGEGGQYNIHYYDPVREESAHAMAFFRLNRETLIFFDPNAGEFKIKNENLEKFMRGYYQKWFNATPFKHVLVKVAPDIASVGSQSTYTQ